MMRNKDSFYITVDGVSFTNPNIFKNYAVAKGYANRVFKCISRGEIMGIVVKRMQKSCKFGTPKYYGFRLVEWNR